MSLSYRQPDGTKQGGPDRLALQVDSKETATAWFTQIRTHHVGYVHKRGGATLLLVGNRDYRRRWMVLKDHHWLSYYDSEEDWKAGHAPIKNRVSATSVCLGPGLVGLTDSVVCAASRPWARDRCELIPATVFYW
jgi:hypothetical protein